MQMFKIPDYAEDLRLFIDSSQTSLKVVLHSGKKYASIPVRHSIHLKEMFENLALILTKLNYNEYEWTNCGDLKLLSIILGQQSGYTR